MKIIKCANLSKAYGKEKYLALDNLNLEIEKNSIFGFLGPNGAGKTTTLKLLTGLMKPTKGEVWINDNLISENKEISKKIAYLSQSPYYYNWMNANQLLMFVASLFNYSKKESQMKIDQLLELCGLTEHKYRKIGSYSGGMIQRLGIAQALINEPDVLFLDEPVSDMDPLGRKEILDFIKQLKDSTTIFMSSHILEDVERVCDSVGIINKGKLIKVSKTNDLKKEFMNKGGFISFELATNKDFEQTKTWLNQSINKDYNLNGNKIIVSQENFNIIRNDFFNMISTNSINLESFQTRKPSLEDIFISIIGDDNNAKYNK